jgi:hypothetical protein
MYSHRARFTLTVGTLTLIKATITRLLLTPRNLNHVKVLSDSNS